MLDTHTLNLQQFYKVGANITTVRLMDPTDYQITNLIRDWEDRMKKDGGYYRVDPGQVRVNIQITYLIKKSVITNKSLHF